MEKYPSWEISTICIYRGLLSALSAQSSSMPEMPCMYSPKRSSLGRPLMSSQPLLLSIMVVSEALCHFQLRVEPLTSRCLGSLERSSQVQSRAHWQLRRSPPSHWQLEGSAPCCCRCWHSGSVRVILFYKGKHVEDSETNASIGRSEEKWWKDQLVKTIP